MTRSFQRLAVQRTTAPPSDRPPRVVALAPVSPSPLEAPAADSFEPASTPRPAEQEDDRPSAPPVYFGDLRLYTWSNSAKMGMTVSLGVLDRSFTDIHPFKGLGIGKENGQRFRLWIAEHCEDERPISEAPVVYKGEAVLSFWSDDPRGMTVKFLLDDGPDGASGKHPFDGFPAGPKEGQTFQGVCWAISDEDNIQDPRRIKLKTPFFALKEVTQAQILCRDQKFITYLKSNEVALLDGEVSDVDVFADGPAYAADVVRRHLGIESRGELGHQTVAAERARMRWARLRDEYMRQRDWNR
jgi:hypothetical protein